MGIQKFIGSINDLNSNKSGKVNANGAIIEGVKAPVNDTDAVNKAYVDALEKRLEEALDKLDKKEQFESRDQNNKKSWIALAPKGVIFHGGEGIDDNTVPGSKNGGGVIMTTGHGVGDGSGGDINMILGVGGSEGKPGEFKVIGGTLSTTGALKLRACKDPGQPERHELLIWFDSEEKVLKVRMFGKSDLILTNID